LDEQFFKNPASPKMLQTEKESFLASRLRTQHPGLIITLLLLPFIDAIY